MNLDTRDDWGLVGKVAIVTGGGAAGDGIGNGRASAILLAKAGARVVVVDRDLALAEHTVKTIAGLPGEAIAVQADLTRARDCAAMVEAALDRFGRLDLLDNNVGIPSRGTVLDETEENWRHVMQVNVDTMFLAAKHAIPAMKRAGGGAIVNVSSISALRPRGLTVYSVSKGAVIALTRAMAVDHGPDGIRVNCVAPGFTMSEGVKQHPEVIEALRDVSVAARTIQRDQVPEDVVGAVVYLAGPTADFVTGQTIVIDGGQYFH